MSSTNPTDFNKRLGAAVRARRVAAGMSQSDLAKPLGVTFQQVQKNERGINRISVEALIIIAKAINTTPQQLIDAACADDMAAIETTEAGDKMSDRLTLETVRSLSDLPVARQRIARNVIKALGEEEAA